jgi:ketosteroid isomerase-like protein
VYLNSAQLHNQNNKTMKKILTGLVVLTCFIACKNANSDNSNADADNKYAENTKVVYHAIETGDPKGLDSVFSDDAVDHAAGPKGEDLSGRENIKAELVKIHNYFDGLKMEMMQHATSADGMYHYATVRMTGTAKANPWGMPVGMKMDNTSVDMVKMKDGKCVEHWSFMSQKDVNDMMKMMGGAQPPAMDSSKMKK